MAAISSFIGLNNKLSYTDVNQSSEDFFCGLLNLVYNLNLTNLNLKINNYPAIDLGDEEAGVCFQITSTTNSQKIQDTLNKFSKYELNRKFKYIYFLLLNPKKNYSREFVIQEINFDKKYIMDINDLVYEISQKEVDEIKKISTYCENSLKLQSRCDQGYSRKMICKKISDRSLLQITGKHRSVNLSIIVERNKYKKILDEFLESNKQVFSIISPSGYGKTNLMYQFFQSLEKKFDVILYSLGLMNSSIESKIEKDFQYELEKRLSFRNIIDSGMPNKKALIIMLDGIDEHYNIDELKVELMNLLGKYNYKELKLILSCRCFENEFDTLFSEKYGIWDDFLHFNGRENIIFERMFITNNNNSCQLIPLNDEELNDFWNKLSLSYGTSVIEGSNINEISGVRVPYFLTMTCEVFGEKVITKNFSLKILYEKWFSMKFSYFQNPQKAALLIGEMAKLCINENENIELEELYKIDRFFNNVDIIENALRLGVIKTVLGEGGCKAVKFVNFEMFIYVFLFIYLKIDKRKFEDIVPKLNKYLQREHLILLRGLVFGYSLLYPESDSANNIPFDIYQNRDALLCSICSKPINIGDKISYIYMMYSSKFEVDTGEINLCHHSCSAKGRSILAIDDPNNEKISTLNISDFVVLNKISEILPSLVEKQKKENELIWNIAKLENRYILKYDGGKRKGEIFVAGNNQNKAVPVIKNKSTALKYARKLEPLVCKAFNEYSRMTAVKLDKSIFSDVMNLCDGNILCITNVSSISVEIINLKGYLK